MSTGWRKGFADTIAAIRGTLADAVNAGSMSAAEFIKLAGLPTSAVPTARLINTTAPLTGGGDLSADRTLALSAASGAAAGSMSAADFSKLAALPSTAPPTSRLINTTAPLTGGGDLSADRTLALSAASAIAAGSMAAADFAKLATVPVGIGVAQFYVSPVIDFTAGSTGNVLFPAVAGKIWVPITYMLVYTVAAGTCTTGLSCAFSAATVVGTGAPAAIQTTTQINNAIAAAGVPVLATSGLSIFGGGAGVRPSPSNTAGTVDVTTPAAGTGGFALQGYFVSRGCYL